MLIQIKMKIKLLPLLLSSLIPTLVSGDDMKIIGGQDAPIERYPYAVILRQGGEDFCGGSLIAPDVVLTAA
jgi:secreted trypsin-like serine protease